MDAINWTLPVVSPLTSIVLGAGLEILPVRPIAEDERSMVTATPPTPPSTVTRSSASLIDTRSSPCPNNRLVGWDIPKMETMSSPAPVFKMVGVLVPTMVTTSFARLRLTTRSAKPVYDSESNRPKSVTRPAPMVPMRVSFASTRRVSSSVK